MELELELELELDLELEEVELELPTWDTVSAKPKVVTPPGKDSVGELPAREWYRTRGPRSCSFCAATWRRSSCSCIR